MSRILDYAELPNAGKGYIEFLNEDSEAYPCEFSDPSLFYVNIDGRIVEIEPEANSYDMLYDTAMQATPSAPAAPYRQATPWRVWDSKPSYIESFCTEWQTKSGKPYYRGD